MIFKLTYYLSIKFYILKFNIHIIAYPTYDEWSTFLDKCNVRRMYSDHAQAHRCFEQYMDRTVQNWSGYVVRVEDYRQSLMRYLHHAVTILVKMQPTEFQDMADLLLTFDSELVDDYNDLLDSLQRGMLLQRGVQYGWLLAQHYYCSLIKLNNLGNKIVFNATIKSMAVDQQTRHLHVISIGMLDGFMEIAPHIHHGGRYADKPRLKREELQHENHHAHSNEENQPTV